MRPLTIALAVTVALGGTVGAGCGSKSSDSAKGPDGPMAKNATFTYALSDDPGSLDFATNGSSVLLELAPYAYDSLIASIGTEIKGNLATEWSIAPREARFTIRDGVKCSDGSAVTPSVIAESFSYLKNPSVQFPLFGSVTDWTVEGDDTAGTVTFRFGEPVGFPLQTLADIPIACGKGLKDRKLLRRHTSGSGPYELTEAVPNDHYTLTLRRDYAWGPDGVTAKQAGLPAKVVLRVVSNPSTVANLLLTDRLNAAVVSEPDRARLAGADIRIKPSPKTISQVVFNHAQGRATADPAVRRALTMALDREGVAKVGQGEVTNNLVPPLTNPCPEPGNGEAIPAFDPAAAAAELESAGWRKGPDGVRAKDGKALALTVPLSASAPDEWKAAAELIIKAWRELGVDVKTRQLADTAFVQTLYQGDWDASPMFQLSTPNPAALAGFLTGPPPPQGQNLFSISNDAYEQAADQALSASSTEEACQGWNEGEKALYEQADMIPILTSDTLWALDDRTEYSVSGNGIVPSTIRMHEG